MGLVVNDLGLSVLVDGTEKALLEPVSVQVGAGEIVGVTGPSGSGKSTLLRLVAGLDRRSGGEVLLDGRRQEAGWLPEFRSRVLLVPQEPPAGAGRPLDLVRRAARFRVRRQRAALVEAVVAEFAALGLGAGHLERAWQSLSGGEGRRAFLGLALALQPDFLMLDEPSAGLDATAVEALVSRLERGSREGLGVLLVSHSEILLARLASRVLVFHDGRLQAEGATAELLPGAFAELERER